MGAAVLALLIRKGRCRAVAAGSVVWGLCGNSVDPCMGLLVSIERATCVLAVCSLRTTKNRAWVSGQQALHALAPFGIIRSIAPCIRVPCERLTVFANSHHFFVSLVHLQLPRPSTACHLNSASVSAHYSLADGLAKFMRRRHMTVRKQLIGAQTDVPSLAEKD
jgi:hypothetical protein